MTSRTKKIEIGILAAALAVLFAVWVLNGYDDTWLYVTAAIVVLPTSWFVWKNRSIDRS